LSSPEKVNDNIEDDSNQQVKVSLKFIRDKIVSNSEEIKQWLQNYLKVENSVVGYICDTNYPDLNEMYSAML